MQIWRIKRQLVGIVLFGSIAILIVGGLLYFILTYGTCRDGIQNRDEKGIDCGGSCPTECLIELPKKPIQLWKRFFKISQGLYDIGALVQNNNQLLSGKANYVLKAYDNKAVLIFSKNGSIMLFPGEKALIFEPNVRVGLRDPERVELELVVPKWERIEQIPPPVNVVEHQFVTGSSPRVDAIVENASIFPVKNIVVAVFLHGLKVFGWQHRISLRFLLRHPYEASL